MRPSVDEYFLRIAHVVASRATCVRRQVGCVLVDKHRHIIATGYNGLSVGEAHCIEVACPHAEKRSGTPCNAIHAENNALLQCPDTGRIHTVYCTASPCISCTRLLLNTSAERVVFNEKYPHPEAAGLWMAQGRDWVYVELS